MGDNKPLAGRRILVTRASEQASALAGMLEEQGAEAISIPTIKIVPPASYFALDSCLRRIPEYQWLIVTSKNGVDALRQRMEAVGVRSEDLAHLHTAAVGAATASALRAIGVRVDFVPEKYVAEAVVAGIQHEVAGKNVLLVRGALGRDVIPDALEKAGASVDVAEAYRTVVPEESAARLRELFASSEPPEIATFASSSAVDNFFSLIRAAGLEQRPEHLRAASIGPITSATLREHGWGPWVEAQTHDLPGLVRALAAVLVS